MSLVHTVETDVHGGQAHDRKCVWSSEWGCYLSNMSADKYSYTTNVMHVAGTTL